MASSFFLDNGYFHNYSVLQKYSNYISCRENLYNTNEKFDYGGFRELMEQMSQAQSASTLFTFRFNDPGVYAFYPSSDINQKMVKGFFNISMIMLFWLFMFWHLRMRFTEICWQSFVSNLPSCNERNFNK